MKNKNIKTIKIRIWFGKVFFESFLIMISILAALAIQEWSDTKAKENMVLRSVSAFKQEAHQSLNWLDDSSPYHKGLYQLIVKMSMENRSVTGEEIRQLLDGLNPYMLRASSWDTMVDTGVLQYMDLDLVSALSLTQNIQKRFEKLYNEGLRELIKETFDLNGNSGVLLYITIRFFKEITEAEEEMLTVNSQVIELLSQHQKKLLE
tara:strand:- start:2188 stop:2805 length:618 start_codon:yes stop_codon:yes gene_type:complete